jgi:hypothetical protein
MEKEIRSMTKEEVMKELKQVLMKSYREIYPDLSEEDYERQGKRYDRLMKKCIKEKERLKEELQDKLKELYKQYGMKLVNNENEDIIDILERYTPPDKSMKKMIALVTKIIINIELIGSMRKKCKCEEMKICQKIGAVREKQYQNEVFDFGSMMDSGTPCKEYPLKLIETTFSYCPECGGNMPIIGPDWNTFWNTFVVAYEFVNDK